MEPVQVAGAVSLSVLHNDVHMEGVYKSGYGTAVQVYLKNGYGISLASSSYGGDTLPIVCPIRRKVDGSGEFDYAWLAHPDFAGIRDSERGCDVDRAVEILTYLRDNT